MLLVLIGKKRARGGVAGNHFENVTGNAIHVGLPYIEAVSWVGAFDVVVSDTTIV